MITLQAGDTAPDFTSTDQNGNPISLSDFRGKKVVLYFYPKDNTPACTAESCDLRDHYQTFLAQGYVVLGVSSDSQRAHQNFIKKYQLPFPLISDQDKSVHEAYGTWGEKQMFGRHYMGTLRTTFVIDEAGIILDVISKVDTKAHAAQILK